LNDRLSLQRAISIRDLLDMDAPGLAHKSRVAGLGYRENIIGTGTDDSRDAVDRRVEFKVIDCAEVSKQHQVPIAAPAPEVAQSAPGAAGKTKGLPLTGAITRPVPRTAVLLT
jgi:hypothetical protein